MNTTGTSVTVWGCRQWRNWGSVLFVSLVLVWIPFGVRTCGRPCEEVEPLPERAPGEYLPALEEIVVCEAPVRVGASHLADGDSKSVTISVDYGDTHCHVSDTVPDDWEGTWGDWVKRRNGWRDRYLFIAGESLDSPWRDPLDHVFVLEGRQLVPVGAIAHPPAAGRERLAPGYRDGVFLDRFDAFQGELGGFGCKGVGWPLVLREEEGQFTVDLERTWATNQVWLQRNEAIARTCLGGGPDDAALQDMLLATAGENALLAKYCGRNEDLERYRQQAQAVLDKPHRAQLRLMLRRITPGELPSSDDGCL